MRSLLLFVDSTPTAAIAEAMRRGIDVTPRGVSGGFAVLLAEDPPWARVREWWMSDSQPTLRYTRDFR